MSRMSHRNHAICVDACCVSLSMPSSLWTQTTGMCTPGVSVSETETLGSPDKRSLSDFLLLSSYFLFFQQERLEVTSSSFSYPLWSVPRGKHFLIWAIFLSYQILSPLGRAGLRPSALC